MSLRYEAPLFTLEGVAYSNIYPSTHIDLVDRLEANYTVSVASL